MEEARRLLNGNGLPRSDPGPLTARSSNGGAPRPGVTALVLPAAAPARGGPGLALGVAPELVPLAGRPVIAHVVDALRAAGASRVAVALPDEDLGAARAALGPDLAERCEFIWLESRGRALDALRVAARTVDGGPWLLTDSTTIAGETLGAQLRAFNGAAGWRAFIADEQRRPRRPVPVDDPGARRFAPLRAHGHLLGAEALEELLEADPDELGDGWRGVDDALAGIAAEGALLAAEGWLSCGPEPTQLLAANRELFRRACEAPEAAGTAGGRPDELVDERATVDRSELTGPLAIGPGASVRRARIGPNSSIGADAFVMGAAIEDSIVLPRAAVINCGEPIRGCVVGPRGIVPGWSAGHRSRISH